MRYLNKKNMLFPYIFIAIISVALFTLFTGGRIVFVDDIDWLLADDSRYHYLNWLYFQNTPFFQFPIFNNPLYGMEFASTLVLNDAIPIMALVFKVFKALLPFESQYFGLWILVCFLLQTLISFKLLKKFSSDNVLCLIFSIFFTIAPIFLWRLWGHYALMSQWIVLAAFLVYFSEGFSLIKWLLLILLSFLINPYIAGMLYPIFLADIYYKRKAGFINKNESWRHIGIVILYSTTVLILLGYVGFGSSLGAGGYSNYRFNLNSFFDTDTLWSLTLPNLASVANDYEGFGFLGLGVIILIFIAALDFFLAGNSISKELRSKLLIITIPCIMMLVFSLTNMVTLGDEVLWSYDVPIFLKPLTKIFRSAGRFSWPLYYFIYLLLFIIISRSGRIKVYLYLIPLLVSLQLYDTQKASSLFRLKHSEVKNYWRTIGGGEKVYQVLLPNWESPLVSSEWDNIGKKYNNFIYVYPKKRTDRAFPIALFAAKNSMAINFGYFSRYNKKNLKGAISKIDKELLDNKFNKESVYLITEDSVWAQLLLQDKNLHLIKEIDGFKIFAPFYFN